jgi:hypothetical protein
MNQNSIVHALANAVDGKVDRATLAPYVPGHSRDVEPKRCAVLLSVKPPPPSDCTLMYDELIVTLEADPSGATVTLWATHVGAYRIEDTSASADARVVKVADVPASDAALRVPLTVTDVPVRDVTAALAAVSEDRLAAVADSDAEDSEPT